MSTHSTFAAPSVAGAASAAARPTRVRYLILAMLFIVTTVNYADRATLSITGPAMKAEFGFDSVQLGFIFSAFSWAYVAAQLPGGWLLDRYGARKIYAVSIVLWSLFTLLQAFTGALAGVFGAVTLLFALRFCVGLSESPAFPANAKLSASWFPTAERGTASAIFNSAQYFAAVVFTPLMAGLTQWMGWHHVYLWMGVIGFVLAGVWLKVVHNPADHPRANKAEREYIAKGGGLLNLEPQAMPSGIVRDGRTWANLGQLMRSRMMLGIYLGQFSINVLTYFFLTWFPVYLVQQRHMSILKAGFMASLPALCGFLGGVLGGVISDRLIKRGASLTVARKTPIVLGMLLSVTMIFCNYVDNEWLVVGLMALAFFGKGIGALGWAVVSDTAPKEIIGLAGSVFNMFGNAAGIVTPIVIGYILAHTGSFNGALVFVGLNALVTVVAYLVIVPEIKRLELKPR